jgi:leader peptidase (prepilin peptidase)/N-methyltransferase
MQEIIYAFVGLFGLTVGSFLNVLIYRLPRQKKFVFSRSVCPNCQNELRWYHNIPLFSFAFLLGRCAFCKAPISWRYPLVEFLNAVFYMYFYWQFGWGYQFLVFSFLSSSLLAIFFIDLDFQIIPDAITIPGMLLGLGLSWLPGGIGILSSIIGLLVGGGSLYVMAIIGDLIFKKDSMGGGDIKMTAMLGAFLGWQQMLFIFICSSLIGLVVSLIIMTFSKRLRQTRIIPFGPFLALAAAVSMIYGRQIIDFYINNFLKAN